MRHGHFALVQLLLDAGADIDAREVQTHSNTAVSVAAREASPEMVEFLLGRGADPWITGWMGIDAFAAARLRKDENAPRVRAVLESHAKSRKRTG